MASQPRSLLPLDQSKFLEELERGVDANIAEQSVQDMFAISRGIRDFLDAKGTSVRQQPFLVERCEKLYAKTALVAISRLPEQEVLKLLATALLTAFKIPNYDLHEKLRMLIISTPDLEERDLLKQRLRQAFLDNNEVFEATQENSSVPLPKTVGGWLKHFNVFVNGKKATTLQRADYFTTNDKYLAPQQSSQLRAIIEAFEYLKLSSINLESDAEMLSIIDDNGEPKVYRAGILEDVKESTEEIELLENLNLLKKSEPEPEVVEPKLERPAPILKTTTTPTPIVAMPKPPVLAQAPVQTPPPPAVAPSISASQVLAGLEIPALDSNTSKRLDTIIEAALRGIRNDVATEEILMRSTKLGGLGLESKMAQSVLTAIHTFAPQVQQGRSTVVAGKASSGAQPSARPTASVDTLPKTTISQERPAQLAQAATDQPPAVVPKPLPIVIPTKPTPAPVSAPKPIIAPVRPAPTPSMVDVQGKPPVAGPIDELHLFTLTDFRRLSPNAKQATARLREKIKLLEEDSYAKMTDGVQAWRSSPLNALYLALVNESLTTGQPIASIISGRQATGQSSLTPDEFAAIRELNQQLKF